MAAAKFGENMIFGRDLIGYRPERNVLLGSIMPGRGDAVRTAASRTRRLHNLVCCNSPAAPQLAFDSSQTIERRHEIAVYRGFGGPCFHADDTGCVRPLPCFARGFVPNAAQHTLYYIAAQRSSFSCPSPTGGRENEYQLTCKEGGYCPPRYASTTNV